MEDNVVPMPSKLDRLAIRISDDLNKLKANDGEWVTLTLDVCAALVEARNEFKDHKGFGHWCDTSGIKLNGNDRAAAIAMGRDPVRLKTVLEKTESRSLRLIYENEFRSSSDPKTIMGPKPIKLTVPTQKALDALKRMRAKGERITQRTVGKEAGVSQTSVRRAFTMEQAVAAAAGGPSPEPEPVIDPASFSMSAQQKLEAYKRQLEKGNDLRAETLARERLEVLLKARYKGLDDRVTQCIRLLNRKFPFSRIEFKKLMMVVHPDNSASKEMRDEMFSTINDREVILQPGVEADLADKARAARLADLDRTMQEANAWFAANPGKKKWPGPGAT
jgi:hypothetical protein